MKHLLRLTTILTIAGFTGLLSCGKPSSEKVQIKGVYGHPNPLWDKGYDLSDLGINAVFVHRGSIKHDMVDRARSQGLKVFAEFPTLNGKGYVKNHPEAWPVNEKGEKAEAASWFMGVCPSDTGFRRYRFGQLRQLLSEYELDGVWMDYVHWHAQFEEPEPILPETCFCNQCLTSFSESTGINIPAGSTRKKARWILSNQDNAWRDWRCRVIRDDDPLNGKCSEI
ncbi:MAG: hypothetical protein R6U40_08535 [Desulfobacterales bacterium]